MMKKYIVEIPEFYLLTIAVYGRMGDGELPDLMQKWAKKECDKLGLNTKVKELQAERLEDMRQRLRNTLGDEMVNNIETTISQVMDKIKS